MVFKRGMMNVRRGATQGGVRGASSFVFLCGLSVILFSACVNAASITITNLIDEPHSRVAIQCQSTTRSSDNAFGQIAPNETFTLSFKPSVILFNTEVWCDALREIDGATAHFRVYWQKADWPFTPFVDWQLFKQELVRRPADGIGPLGMRFGRLLFRSFGPLSLMATY